VQIALYRIVQEALNNVVKHSAAHQVQVRLASSEAGVVLRVHDDGQGFAAEMVAPDSFGLSIMRERAAGIGARLRILSRPGRGTSVTVAWRPPRSLNAEPSPAALDHGSQQAARLTIVVPYSTEMGTRSSAGLNDCLSE
jgi:nitrate/nitrite-specific signal transduction histidine kinase